MSDIRNQHFGHLVLLNGFSQLYLRGDVSECHNWTNYVVERQHLLRNLNSFIRCVFLNQREIDNVVTCENGGTRQQLVQTHERLLLIQINSLFQVVTADL